MSESGKSRREFLQWAAVSGLGGAYLIQPPPQPGPDPPPGPPVRCAVVGVGRQGRRLLTLLETSPRAAVAAYCDVYPPYLRRSERLAPQARGYPGLSRLLAGEPDVEAVFVATPTHLHRAIVEQALEAGRHVYCEAPMASSSADARSIAARAQAAGKIFAVGLQLRSNRHFEHALKFLEVEAVGRLALGAGSHHVNNSWRRAASDANYERQLNWRLSPDVSLGLLGEFGVHAFDTTLRASNEVPAAVTSFGSLVKWDDGREIPDTVQAVFEFPSGFQSRFSSTLTNSYGGRSHVLHGTAGSMLLTEQRCWLFKEVDAPSFGWEVYAMRERVVTTDGIVLVADATKLLERNELPGGGAQGELTSGPTSLELAVEDFLASIREDRPPAAGAVEGLRSVVMAEKAVESLRTGRRVVINSSEFAV